MDGFADYESHDALGLAELVRGGAADARELLEAAIARAEAHNPKINAICVRMYDQAEAAIDAGLPDGPLRGVPFLLKNLHAPYAGAPLTNGSRLFEGFVPDHDGELVRRYKRAGLVIFGRTNSPELGLSYTTEPSLYGPTRNPWNLDRVAGGSSGGSAAAVAARIVPAAHGSDGGGSIRVPASCCGLFGLKPTRARTPAGPAAGESWAGMSGAHAITLTVRDSAALLDAASGPDAGDPYWAPRPARPFLDEVGVDPGRLRIAFSARTPNEVPVAADCIAAMERAAQLCRDLGHDIEEAEPTYENQAMGRAFLTVIATHVRADTVRRAAELGRAAAPEDVERMTWALARMGREVSGAAYVDAIHAIHRVGRQVARFFVDYDVLLTPSMAQPPIAIGALDPMTEDEESYIAELKGFAAFPPLSNVTGAPAMSVPLFWNADGLPIGAQFIGRLGGEATLLRLAAQLEEAAPWADRRPELAA